MEPGCGRADHLAPPEGIADGHADGSQPEVAAAKTAGMINRHHQDPADRSSERHNPISHCTNGRSGSDDVLESTIPRSIGRGGATEAIDHGADDRRAERPIDH